MGEDSCQVAADVLGFPMFYISRRGPFISREEAPHGTEPGFQVPCGSLRHRTILRWKMIELGPLLRRVQMQTAAIHLVNTSGQLQVLVLQRSCGTQFGRSLTHRTIQLPLGESRIVHKQVLSLKHLGETR